MFGSQKQKGLAAVFCALIFGACSSSVGSGTSSSSGSGSSGDSTTITSASLQSVSSLPDIDLDTLDVAGSTSSSLIRSVTSDDSATGEFSAAGCETRSQIEQFKDSVKEFQGNKCILEKLDEKTNFDIPNNGTYSYYEKLFTSDEIPQEDGEAEASENQPEDGNQGGGPMSLRMRVGIINDVLHLAVCSTEFDENSFRQFLNVRFEVDGGEFVGDIMNSHPSFNDSTVTDGSRVTVRLAVEDPSLFQEGDEASLEGEFSGYWGSGQMALSAEKVNDVITNTLSGVFHSGGSQTDFGEFSNRVLAKTNSEQGCAAFEGSGTQPARTAAQTFNNDSFALAELSEAGIEGSDSICWKDPAEDNTFCDYGQNPEEDGCSHPTLADFVEAADEDGNCTFTHGDTQCFSYEATAAGGLAYYVLPTEDALYAADVAGGAPADSTVDEISFGDESWDCEAEGEFTALEANFGVHMGEEMASCFQTLNEAHNNRNMESCFDREHEKKAQDQGCQGEDCDFGGDDSFDFNDDGTGDQGDDVGGGGDENI